MEVAELKKYAFGTWPSIIWFLASLWMFGIAFDNMLSDLHPLSRDTAARLMIALVPMLFLGWAAVTAVGQYFIYIFYKKFVGLPHSSEPRDGSESNP